MTVLPFFAISLLTSSMLSTVTGSLSSGIPFPGASDEDALIFAVLRFSFTFSMSSIWFSLVSILIEIVSEIP